MKKIKIEVNGQWQEIEISNKSHAEFEKAVKPEFKVGEWVYVQGHAGLYRINSFNGTNLRFDSPFIGSLVGTIIGNHNLRHATEDEIKAHLIKEAEKRGYKNGVKYLGIEGGRIETIGNEDNFNYFSHTTVEYLTDRCGGSVYENGKWAEIISNPTTIKLNDSHEAEICDGFIKVGYQEFTFKAIKKLNKAIKSWQSQKD